jgi:hypothetical protein
LLILVPNAPIYVSILFGLITILTLFFILKAIRFSKPVLIVMLLWLVVQSLIGFTGFYANTQVLPPRFLLLILPPFISIFLLFVTKRGKSIIRDFDPKILTLLHCIRIPVEWGLYLLASYHSIPYLMTFEGSNFDIISGITALPVFYFGFVKKKLNRMTLLLWNSCCLMLLLNIVITAILSAPFPFQQFAFNQPNIAVFYFPIYFLPGFIVPVVFLAHVVEIKRLINEKSGQV